MTVTPFLWKIRQFESKILPKVIGENDETERKTTEDA